MPTESLAFQGDSPHFASTTARTKICARLSPSEGQQSVKRHQSLYTTTPSKKKGKLRWFPTNPISPKFHEFLIQLLHSQHLLRYCLFERNPCMTTKKENLVASLWRHPRIRANSFWQQLICSVIFWLFSDTNASMLLRAAS